LLEFRSIQSHADRGQVIESARSSPKVCDSVLTPTRGIGSNLGTPSAGCKSLFDDYYELAWGLPQVGRTFYAKTLLTF
jgi:hypothetical protein